MQLRAIKKYLGMKNKNTCSNIIALNKDKIVCHISMNCDVRSDDNVFVKEEHK